MISIIKKEEAVPSNQAESFEGSSQEELHGVSPHLILLQEEGKSWKCRECDKIFARSDNLSRHVETVHRGLREHVCAECGKAFCDKFSLRRHMRLVHKGEKEHVCGQCGKAFGQKVNLMRHFEAMAHNGMPRKSRGEDTAKNYECRECGNMFTRSDNLNHHMRTVHQGLVEKKKKCDDESDKTSGQKATTLDQGLPVKKNECDVSDKASLDPIHVGEHMCAECCKVFCDNFSLRRHVRLVHKGLKKHVCGQCGKAFGQKVNLMRHLRGTAHATTPKEREEAVASDALDDDLLSPHLTLVPEDGGTKKRRYECYECGNMFTRCDNLNHHVRTVHQGRNRRKCQECGLVFCDKFRLNLHVKIVHRRERDHLCNECGKAFGRNADLTRHMEAVHQGGQEDPLA